MVWGGGDPGRWVSSKEVGGSGREFSMQEFMLQNRELESWRENQQVDPFSCCNAARQDVCIFAKHVYYGGY